MTFPWEEQPPAALSTEDEITAIKRDFAYAVVNTAVMVHSSNEAFHLVVNTPRGQIMPRGEVKFSDGTTVEVQDIGMCQPNVPSMSMREIMTHIMQLANELGLELVE